MKKTITFFRRAVLTLMLLLATSVQAWAQTSVSYNAYNTGTRTFETLTANSCTVVTSSTTTFGAAGTETWYVVNSNVTFNSSRIEVLGTVNLILADGYSLRAEKGLHVASGVTLNIYDQSSGTGELHSFATEYGQAGIGGNYGEAGGILTIHGGSIEAIGAQWGAGIGGGREGNGGSITIYGGSINATGGTTGAGIGGGVGANCGTITIVGGTVIATATTSYEGDNSQAIGSGDNCNSGDGTLIIDNIKVYSSAGAANPVAPANRLSTCHSKYAKLMLCSPHNYVNDVCTYCGGTPDAANPGTYLVYQPATHTFAEQTATNPIIVNSATTTLGADNTETWYTVSNNITVSNRITVYGTVHLILCDGKTLTASSGITVNTGNTLNIYGQASGTGTLNATAAGGNHAGIGTLNDQYNALGTINIHGGIVTAEGADWSAGIGGGVQSGGGSIAIYGGTVNATGHDGIAEGIGCGSSGPAVTKSLADGLRVTVNNSSSPVSSGDRVSSLSQKVVRVEPCTTHSYSNNRCIYCATPHYGHITYNSNGATGGTVPTDNTNYANHTDVTVMGNTGNLALTGYAFAGWNTQADGLGTDYASASTISLYGDVTLYAQWNPITYIVRFNNNSDAATGTMSDQTMTYDAAQALTANAFSLNNRVFAGWSTTPDGTLAYTDGQSVVNLAAEQSAVVNLYALWAQSTYTITYNLNGGSVATPNPTTYNEYSHTFTLVNPTRTGYTFTGWTGTGLTEPTITVTISTGSTGNRSYTANWDQRVDYLAYNTTAHVFETHSISSGITTVTSGTTSMSGGWYVVESDVTIGSRITVTGTVNLILREGTTMTASEGITVHSGYTLNIYTEASGSGTLVASVTSGANFAAIGTENSFSSQTNTLGTVNIHGGIITANGGPWSAGIGGGVNSGSGAVSIYGGTISANTGEPGYGEQEAVGRGSSGSTVTKSIADGLRVTVGSNTTPVEYGDRLSNLGQKSVRVEPCHEHHLSNGHCSYCGITCFGVIYNANNATSGSVPTDAIAYESGQTVTVLGNTGNLERTGYTFAGWNTKANGTGTTYAANATFTVNANANTTLYARWTPITYTVRFHKNDDAATGAMSDQTLTYDAAHALTANAFTYEGYELLGWRTTADGPVVYTDGQSVVNLSTTQGALVDLYAFWAVSYSITYDLDGGSVTTPNPTYYTIYSSDITLNNPERAGYTFLGWTGSNGDTPQTSVTIAAGSTGNKSYTAHWEMGDFYLAYNTTTHDFDAITIPTNATAVTGSNNATTLSGGWYVVSSNVTFSKRVTISGTVNLILREGKTMTASLGITVSTGNTLNIYSQVGGTGELVSTVSGTTNNAGIGSVGNSNNCGNINIHGGTITATSGPWSAGIGGGVNRGGGTINIYGGTVNATGNNGDAQAIGKGSSGGNSTRYLADGLRVFVGSNTTPVDYADRVSSLNNKSVRIEPCTEHNSPNGRCTKCGRYQWYTVTYNGNGATSGSVPVDATHYAASGNPTATVLGNPGSLERTGYNFAGWSTSANANSELLIPNSEFTVSGPVTLYARWTPVTYTVRYHSNHPAATGTMADQTFTYSVGGGLNTNTFSRTGYNFEGWSTSSDGYAYYSDEEGVINLATTQDAVVDLYAVWSPIRYYVYFESNHPDATGNTDYMYFTYDKAQTLYDNEFSLTGYTFAGWSTTNYGAVEYTDGQNVVNLTSTDYANIFLYAVWTPNTYVVRFNKNDEGASGTMADQTLTYDVAGNLTANAFLPPDGKGFGGWSTTTEGVASYFDGQNVINLATEQDDVVNLYAVWSDVYTISYDLAGGSVATDNPTSYTAVSPDITLVNPTREGYTFAGWTGTDLSEATMTVTIATGSTGDRSYTATWTLNTYTITYNLNSGILATANPETYTVETPTFTLNNSTREGYTFAGWIESVNSQPSTLNSQLSITIATGSTGDRSYTATWTPITYTVRFNKNNEAATGTMTDQTFTYDVAQNLSANVFSAATTGYGFAGWSTTADGEVVYSDGQSVSNLATQQDAVVDLYAQWTAIVYSITYDLAGGSLTTTHNSYTVNDATITLDEPTRTGYTFAGWYDNSGFTGDAVTVIASGYTGNVELWAKWTPITYTITYDLAGGSYSDNQAIQQSSNPTTYTVESEAITLVNPERDGYYFVGWTGTGLATTTATVVIPTGSTGDRSYTANWIDYGSVVPYLAYDTTTGTFETQLAQVYTTVSSSTTAMADGWYVVNSNTSINNRIEVTGTVNLILCDGKTLTDNKGFHVPSGATLIIYGQNAGTGTLNATANDYSQAAIGGNNNEGGGKVTIHGGNITATGYYYGAGIGGGYYGIGGTINIYGGAVTALSHYCGAGIGGGYHGNGGTVSIIGGTVTATGGSQGGAGIGGGYYNYNGTGGTVTISGGNITATGGSSGGAGIGGGYYGNGATVTITGGIVNATGGGNDIYCGAGIGGGYNGSGGSVTVSGGTVIAVAGNYGIETSDNSSTQAIGRGRGSSSSGSLTLGDIKVFKNTSATVPVASGNRVSTCRTSYTRIEACTEHHWVENTCSWCGATCTGVAYGRNHATGGTVPVDNTNYTDGQPVTVLGNTGNLERDGYLYAGWNGAADGTGIDYAENSTFTYSGNITLYAKWNPITYNIVYHLDGGDIATPNLTSYTPNDEFTLVNPTKEGWVFGGWTGTGLEYPTPTVTIAAGSFGNREYTATWLPILEYQAYNTNTQDFETLTANSYIRVTPATTTMTGGWYAVYSDVSIASRIEMTGTVNLILCDGATLTAPKGIHVKSGVTLNIYGQSGNTGEVTVANVDTYTSCIGGNKDENCGTITIHGGTVTAAGRNDGNGGAGIGGGFSGNGGTIAIHGGTVSATGSGINGGAGIGGGMYGAGGTSLTITGGIVTANGGGNSYGGAAGIGGGLSEPGYNSVIITGGTVIATSISDAQAIGRGHILSGTPASGNLTLGDMKVYASAGATEPVAADNRENTCRTNYAKLMPCTEHSWLDNTCIWCGTTNNGVAYSGNGATGGTVPTDATIYTNGMTVTVLGNIGNLERTGYTYAGWNTSSNGSGDNYVEDATFAYNGPVTLHAKWSPITYTISYDLDGGTVATPNPESYTIMSDDFTLNNPTKEGWVFGGWTGTGLTTATTTVTVTTGSTGDRTYTATWLPILEYRAYSTTTNEFETLTADAYLDVTSGTTAMSGGWYAVRSNVTVSSRIEVTGTVNLILCDGATLTVPKGLHVPSGATLSIYAQSAGSGAITISGGSNNIDYGCAGIGANNTQNSGTLYIHGGTITTKGGSAAPGIGGGQGSGYNGGTVAIYGGTVNATAEFYGAGIGGGDNGGTGCTSLVITGGTVNATGGSGGAGIGGGWHGNGGGTVTITGGIVNATGGYNAAGIGGGDSQAGCTSVYILGGTVIASAANNAQAIGRGSGSLESGTLTLGDMKVFASANAVEPVDSTIRVNTCRTAYAKLMPCTEHNWVNNSCTLCGANNHGIVYVANGATGGTVPIDATEYFVDQTVTVLGNTGNLERTNYTFNGWNTAADGTGTPYTIGTTFTFSAPVVLYAQWTINTYTITFLNYDGTELQSSQVAYGETPAYTGATPTRAATSQYIYTFTGWLPEIVAVTGNATYTAQYTQTVREYTITYNGMEGATLASPNPTSYTVETPDFTLVNPTREGYTFTGWTGSNGETPQTSVIIHTGTTGDLTYTANWTVNTYTITFVNYDNTELQSSQVAYGETPTYNGATPTRAADEQYTYTFNGWSPEIATVTGNATYTAQYSTTVNEYTITFVNYDNTVLQSSQVAYGETPVYTSATPTRAATAQYTYTFNGWSPAIAAVTGNATYTAQYTAVEMLHDVPYRAYNTTTNQFETLTANTCTSINSQLSTLNSQLSGGWYAVNSNVTIGSIINLAGTVNLILCDGATLTAEQGFKFVGGATLNIYGQTGGTGTLASGGDINTDWSNEDNMTVHGGNFSLNGHWGISINGDIAIYGGDLDFDVTGSAISSGECNVTIYGGNIDIDALDQYGTGIYLTYNSSVVINGGTVDITANDGILTYYGNNYITINGGDITFNSTGNGYHSTGFHTEGGDITINGGNINCTITELGYGSACFEAENGDIVVNGGNISAIVNDNPEPNNEGFGFYTHNGNIILGWSNADDRIFASSYEFFDNGTLSVRSGQSFWNGTESVSGTISDFSKVNGLTLVPNTSTDVAVAVAGGWQAISSPMFNNSDHSETIADVAGLTTGDYDMFRYNEATATWENQKYGSGATGFTTMERGRGYIYRRANDATLTFLGQVNSGNINNYSLSAACTTNTALTGFNLVGNPYTHSIHKGVNITGANLVGGHYALQPDGTWLARLDTAAIATGQAVLVKATAATTISFTDNSGSKGGYSEGPASGTLVFTVTDGQHSDMAYAQFGEGVGLNKIAHLESSLPTLAIPQNDDLYAIAVMDVNVREFPLSLQTMSSGVYTLTMQSSYADMIIIDLLTGKEIDLPYSFTATAADAAERFLVKLCPCDDNSAPFAYVTGNGVVVTGTGTLQVFDVMGRRLFGRELNTEHITLSTSLFPAAGVYVLRLGDKTHKIVIR